jgi:hypothetical protein
MTTPADFGPFIIETDVDRALLGTLAFWLPTYLSQVERERDMVHGALARPTSDSYANTLDDDEWLDHRLPAVVCTTAATRDTPNIEGGWEYEVAWLCVVSTVVRGRTPAETRAVAALLGGTVRRVLVQQQSLAGAGEPFADSTQWVRSHVLPVPDATSSGRYLAACVNEFEVRTSNVVDASVGPLPDPGVDPDIVYDPDPTVGAVTIDVGGVSPTDTPGS